MEQLLPQLLSFPPHPPPPEPFPDAEYDKQIRALSHTLSTISTSKLTGGVKGGGDLLNVLDPSINSLPYLYVLLAYVSASSGKGKNPTISKSFAPNEPLWQKMVIFMDRFDPIQIRYEGHALRRLIELTALQADSLQQPNAAILPIRTAILRIDPSGATLTSSHLNLALLCLQTHEFASALPVLDKDISFIPLRSDKKDEPLVNALTPFFCSKHQSSSGYITLASGLSNRLSYEDFLQYHLYGAMIYKALKDWERALAFLEIVIASPVARDNTGGTSKIQVEAYKKWILIGLIHKGQIPRTPKNISAQATKTYQALSAPYTYLAEVFKDNIKNAKFDDSILDEARYARATWEEDCNEGLVKQVVNAYRQFSVRHLEQTYRALTVAEVARRTSPNPNDHAEAANYLLELISRGQLDAKVSTNSSDEPASWVLRFNSDTNDDTTAQSEEKQYEALRRQIEKIATLTDDIREADRQLGLGKEYIQDAKKAKLAKENGLGDEMGVQGAFPSQDFFSHDEDMMEDVV